jgi:hypothetical protein
MGQFSDMLDKILLVEKQGFNPYTETYSARISQIDTEPTKPTTIPEAYVQAGYENPFANITTDTGELNLSALSTGYNLAPQVGVQQQDYIDFVNRAYQQNIEDYYGAGNILNIGQAGSLEVSKPKVTDASYRFEQGIRQGTDPLGKFKKGDPVYYRWDDNSGEYITYDTKEAYDKAREEYKKTTGEESDLGKEND